MLKRLIVDIIFFRHPHNIFPFLALPSLSLKQRSDHCFRHFHHLFRREGKAPACTSPFVDKFFQRNTTANTIPASILKCPAGLFWVGLV